VRGTDAFICEQCIRHWFRALDQPDVQATETASGVANIVVGVATEVTPGIPPEDPDAIRDQIAAAFSGDFAVSDDSQSVLVLLLGQQQGVTHRTADGKADRVLEVGF
jgi:hypothetical protein